MAREAWEVRLDVEQREMKLSRIMDATSANNRAQALDVALDAYFQLEEILEAEVREMKDRGEELDGDAISVQNYIQLDRRP